jgi:hypothetical protein
MYNQDEVIRQAALCADNHGTQVDHALSSYVADHNDSNREALRLALVAQAAGHESMSHDGSTLNARRLAATAALAAWDGPAPEFAITVGAVQIGTSDAALLSQLGYETSCDSTGKRYAQPMVGSRNAAIVEIATALSEGLRGEPALFRALALLRLRAPKADGRSAAHETKLADVRLHVARVERQAAILRARASGIPAAEIGEIVR